MKLKILLASVPIFFLSLAFPFDASADLYSPTLSDKCGQEELFLPEVLINPRLYQSARKVKYSRTDRVLGATGDAAGYCVDKIEYCSRRNCLSELLIGAPAFGGANTVVLYNAINILINLLINGTVILFFHFANQGTFNKFKPLKLLIITILGYIYDRFAFPIAFTGTNVLTGQSRHPLLSIVILMAIVFVLVWNTFYFIYSKEISETKISRIINSSIFALISNPALLYFYNLYS